MGTNMIVVGMADLNVACYPDSLTTIGLGSCVGISLYDSINKIVGLAHIMLPDSKKIQNNKNVAKFADTAIDKLIKDMVKSGAKKEMLTAKIAGGAQMFKFTSVNKDMQIGDRNIEATEKVLKEYRIPIIAKDVGQNYGRTIEIHSDDGKFVVKTVGHGIKTI